MDGGCQLYGAVTAWIGDTADGGAGFRKGTHRTDDLVERDASYPVTTMARESSAVAPAATDVSNALANSDDDRDSMSFHPYYC